AGSTKEIAKAAGIAESALFKRYRTKRALFLAAMAPPKVDAAGIVRAAAQKRSARQALIGIAEQGLAYFRTAVPRMLPIITHPMIGPDPLWQHMGQNPVRALRNEIQSHLHVEARRGRVARTGTVAAANLFVTSLYSIALFETVGLQRDVL